MKQLLSSSSSFQQSLSSAGKINMPHAGFHRFPLDPTAQEFRPTYHHLYFYSFPPPPPPPPTTAAFMVPLPPSSRVPTRALLLTSVPTNVSESTIRRDLEVFGDVRAVQMERLLRDGIVTVHFYDLRQAMVALNEIQGQHMQQQRRLRQHFDGLIVASPVLAATTPTISVARGLVCGRVVWAQFAFPVVAGLPDRYNQGTVAVTLDSDVDVRDVFEAFGDVKEIRWNKTQRFVEFYDTRAASNAVATLNGQEIKGKKVAVEFYRRIASNHCSDKDTKVVFFDVPKVNHRIPPPCRKERLVVIREVKNGDGLKKNVVFNNNINDSKHRMQLPEKWVDGNGGRNKAAWKPGGRARCDPRFSIKDEGTVVVSAGSCFQDSRTTVMIKNIPNKYSQKLLINMLDNHCIECNELLGDDQQPMSSYDFVYLPIDFVNKCNVGYGFVNMTSAEGAWRLYKAFNHKNWEVFNSRKICEVSYARLQGLEVLKEHFKKSRFPCEEEEYMPVVFTPPRDGRTVTSEPIPIRTIISNPVVVVECNNNRSLDDLTDAAAATRSSISSDCYYDNNNKLLVEDAQSDATGASSVGGGDDI